MKNLFLGIAAAVSLLGAGAVANSAKAEDTPRLIFGVDRPQDAPTLDHVQFFYTGRNYCWYDGGWHGPGFYWCGYGLRVGYGWGGPWGWNGWYGHRGWNGWDGTAVWRGPGYPGWHGAVVYGYGHPGGYYGHPGYAHPAYGHPGYYGHPYPGHPAGWHPN